MNTYIVRGGDGRFLIELGTRKAAIRYAKNAYEAKSIWELKERKVWRK